MPRQTKPKDAFAWDFEQNLGFVYPEEGSRKCVEVKRAKKDGKDYIVLTEWRYFKRGGADAEDWNPIKGMTIPAHNWEEIDSLVQADFEDDPAADPTEEGGEADA